MWPTTDMMASNRYLLRDILSAPNTQPSIATDVRHVRWESQTTSGDGLTSGSRPQEVAKSHVFSVPHDVVGSPGIVVEVRVDAFAQIGLRIAEA